MAKRDDTAGHPHEPEGLQLVFAAAAQAPLQLARPVAHREAGAEGVETAHPERLQLVAALAQEQWQLSPAHASRPRAQRRYALINGSRSPSITASTLPTSTPVRWSLIIW